MRGVNQSACKRVRETWISCYWLKEVVVESVEVVVGAVVSVAVGVVVDVEKSVRGRAVDFRDVARSL
jgi:hypothetical protein